MSTAAYSRAAMLDCVGQVLHARRSTRAFEPTPIALETLKAVLEMASCAPSNSNTQPWRVYAVTGEAKSALTRSLEAAFKNNHAPPPTHFPDDPPSVLTQRQNDFAQRYYEVLGIDRTDAEARARQTLRNYSFFGAPVGLVFSIDKSLRPHSWLDLGLFVQSVMIAAQAHGLATCAQVSFARFHRTISDQLGMPDNEMTVCGMSMGHAQADAAVNRFHMPRRDVDDFLSAKGFA